MFCVVGVVKVGDYGLSKFISCSRRSGHTESIGTVHYMAPEVANGRYGKELDIYALGMVLYVLSTGRNAAYFPEIATTLVEREDPADFLPLNTVILKACHPDPAQRYASAAEMHRALQETQKTLAAE